MPTLVPLPELQTSQVSQLRAVDRPVETSALGTFMQTLIPAATEALDKYNTENRDANIAQGMNDVAMGVTREVSLLDQRNYQQGREFQAVVSTQTEQKQGFAEHIDTLARADGATPDSVLQGGREVLAKNTQAISDSNLDPEIKTALYKANIAELGTYQGKIQKAFSTIATEAALKANTTSAATLYSDIKTHPEYTPDMLASLLGGEAERVHASLSNTEVGLNPEKRQAAVRDHLAGLLNYGLDQIDPTDPTAGAQIATWERVQDVMIHNGTLDMKVAIDVQNKVQSVRVKVLDHNATQVGNIVDQYIWNADSHTDGVSWTNEGIQGTLNTVNDYENRHLITAEVAQKQRKSLYNAATSANEKALAGGITGADIVKNNITRQTYNAMPKGGGDESKFGSEVSKYFDQTEPNPMMAGAKGLAYGIQGDANQQQIPTLITKSVEKMSSTLMTYMQLDAPTASKREGYQYAVQSYNGVRDLYNEQAKKGNLGTAEAILAGFPQAQRNIIAQNFQNGGGLNDVSQALQNPVLASTAQATFGDAVKGLKVDDLKGGWFSKGNTGREFAFWGMSDPVKEAYKSAIQYGMNSSVLQLSGGVTSADSKLAVGSFKTAGGLVPTSGSDAIVPVPAMNSWKTMTAADGTNIGTSAAGAPSPYISAALDTMAERVAKQAGVSRSDVLVYASQNGDQIIVQPFDKEGVLKLDAAGDTWHGVVYNRNQLLGFARDAYTADVKKGVDSITRMPVMGTLTYTYTPYTISDKPKGTQSVGLPSFNFGTRKFVTSDAIANPFDTSKTYAIVPSAPLGQVALVVNRKAVMVTTNNYASIPFNGNRDLGTTMIQHLSRPTAEGFIDQPTLTTGTRKDGSNFQVTTIGSGLNITANKDYADAARAAAGNPQALMDLQLKFMAMSMANQQVVARDLGIPIATVNPYDPRYVTSQVLLGDMKWHTGSYEGIVKIMQAPNFATAATMLRNSSAWADAGDGTTARNKNRLSMLHDYFTLKNKL